MVLVDAQGLAGHRHDVEGAHARGAERESAGRKGVERERDQLARQVEELRHKASDLEERHIDYDQAVRELELQAARDRAQVARERAELERLRNELRSEDERLRREREEFEGVVLVKSRIDQRAEAPAKRTAVPASGNAKVLPSGEKHRAPGILGWYEQDRSTRPAATSTARL